MDRIVVETPLLIWTGESGARAGMVRITGQAAEAIRFAALTGQWLDRRKSRRSVRLLTRIGGTEWKNSAFPEEGGDWVMPINQTVRRKEGLEEGSLVRLTLTL